MDDRFGQSRPAGSPHGTSVLNWVRLRLAVAIFEAFIFRERSKRRKNISDHGELQSRRKWKRRTRSVASGAGPSNMAAHQQNSPGAMFPARCVEAPPNAHVPL